MPFSPKTFVRLLDMAADSLENMSLQPPSPGDAGWTKAPSFQEKSIPVPSVTEVRHDQFGRNSSAALSADLVRSCSTVVPRRPGLTTLSIHVFADELRDLTDILKQSFPFKWNLFTEIVLRLYPNLKMFVMIISMQYDFGKNATGKLELSVKRVLNGLGERVTIECLDEDPKPQEP
ncbi:uncharacterized protein BT62DRAFT_1003898 [Guyanagaster necrorhizus]|uniref:Uncharacterized protein n=1 Tax=Guyanagaster necrorhizus TaxID=856835 RepID=A0A9P8AVP6_9AGAR|nr:uncharacterized protein BT62DRAFT_1003898 [Guyanagaster necrorhizus MCA 3950]KAG7448117.1 hypothetical protein BT62DRAFT_1003898 [Guyanagaster necrorhizus MCA 3950]